MAVKVAFWGQIIVCLHVQNKSGLFGSRLLSQFKKYSKSSDWLEKATFVLVK